MKNEIKKKSTVNIFSNMSLFHFWVISTFFYLFFPLSLILTYLACGKDKTKDLIFALANDFIQTIFIFIIFLSLIVWSIYYFLF